MILQKAKNKPSLGKSGKSAKSKRSRAKASKERFHIVHFTNPSGETVFRVAGYQPDGCGWQKPRQETKSLILLGLSPS